MWTGTGTVIGSHDGSGAISIMSSVFPHRIYHVAVRSSNQPALSLGLRCRASFSSAAAASATKSSGDSEVSNRTVIYEPAPAAELPGLRVQGTAKSDLESYPEIAAFFALNFPIEKDKPYYKEGPEQISETHETNIRKMICYKRTIDGSNKCRHLRYHGLIPGILYGGDPTKTILSRYASSKMLLMTPHNEIHRERDRFSHSFTSRVYDLTIFNSPEEAQAGAEGEVVQVIPSDLQLHPIKNKVFCLNYLRYYPGRPIDIPIKYVNEEESPALKRGGFIVPIKRHVTCIIDEGAPIPEALALECTGVKYKEKLCLDRIIFPEGVRYSKFHINPDTWFHGSVFGKGGGDTPDSGGKEEEED